MDGVIEICVIYATDPSIPYEGLLRKCLARVPTFI